MGGYNTVVCVLTCPRCGDVGPVRVDFRFGLFEFRDYSVGDVVEWGERGWRRPKQRPEGGNFEHEGYTECSVCEKDFWVTVTVRADVLADVVVDPERPGMIP